MATVWIAARTGLWGHWPDADDRSRKLVEQVRAKLTEDIQRRQGQRDKTPPSAQDDKACDDGGRGAGEANGGIFASGANGSGVGTGAGCDSNNSADRGGAAELGGLKGSSTWMFGVRGEHNHGREDGDETRKSGRNRNFLRRPKLRDEEHGRAMDVLSGVEGAEEVSKK